MGIVKRAADLAFTFRFIRMLVLDWKSWDAYKLGIINDEGKRDKNVKIDTDEKKSAYTPFIRMAANLKRLLGSIPGGSSKLGSFAAALYLIKEHHNISDNQINKILEEFGIDPIDFLLEENSWFVIDNKMLSPGVYRIYEDKLLKDSLDDIVFAKDQIRILEDTYPVGDVLGIDIYEAIHVRTNKKIYVTVNEIYK
jgi:chitinase